MPKATVNKDDLPARDENEIRLPGKRLVVKLVAEAKGMNQTADDQFGSRVLPVHRRHGRATLLAGENIRHLSVSSSGLESASSSAFSAGVPTPSSG